jgi:hypothetical protein
MSIETPSEMTMASWLSENQRLRASGSASAQRNGGTAFGGKGGSTYQAKWYLSV